MPPGSGLERASLFRDRITTLWAWRHRPSPPHRPKWDCYVNMRLWCDSGQRGSVRATLHVGQHEGRASGWKEELYWWPIVFGWRPRMIYNKIKLVICYLCYLIQTLYICVLSELHIIITIDLIYHIFDHDICIEDSPLMEAMCVCDWIRFNFQVRFYY